MINKIEIKAMLNDEIVMIEVEVRKLRRFYEGDVIIKIPERNIVLELFMNDLVQARKALLNTD